MIVVEQILAPATVLALRRYWSVVQYECQCLCKWEVNLNLGSHLLQVELVVVVANVVVALFLVSIYAY